MPAGRSSHRSTLNPLMWLLCSFAAGIVAARTIVGEPAVFLLAGALFAAAAFVFRHRNVTALCLLSFAALGAFCSELEIRSVAPERLRRIYDEGLIPSGDPVTIVGTIHGGPEPAHDGEFVAIDVSEMVHRGETVQASGRLRFYLPTVSDEAKRDTEALGLRHSTKVRVACAAEREDRFLNPGVTPRREILDRQGIDVTCTVKSPLLIEILDPGSSGIFGFVFEARRMLISNIRELFSPETAGVLIASSLGDKYFLDRKTAGIFREGGTFHILVISGLHITFIGGVLLLFVRRSTRNRSLQFLITCGSLWIYTIGVGAEPPAVRASVMFTGALLGFAMFRSMTLVNSFGASGLALLVWRPSDLFDPSFQLTFASVGGIVLMAFPLIEKLRAIGSWMPSAVEPFPPHQPRWLVRFCEMIYWNPREWKVDQMKQIWSAGIKKEPLIGGLAEFGVRRLVAFLFEGLLVSLIVQIWMLPLLVWYFHRVSFASIILNLWAGPLMAAETFAALAAILLNRVNYWLAVPLIEVTEFLNDALLFLPSIFVDRGWGSNRLPVFTGDEAGIYFLYFVPVIAAAYAVLRWDPFALIRPKAILTAARMLALTLSFLIFALPALDVTGTGNTPAADGNLRIQFLDVGQGDSAFIVFPNGETMLIDGGGRINFGNDGEGFEPDVARIGETVVSEAIWELGYSKIDHLVASHADTDHIQGLVDAAKNFEIGTAYFAAVQGESGDAGELLAVLSRKGVPIDRLGRGDSFEISGGVVDVLHPSPADAALTENDRSLVFLLTFGERRFLFTGDIEAEAERRILVGAASLGADVIKAPHHGSRTSSSPPFVNATRAAVVVVSAGRRSRFGHPHPEVIDAWSRSGAKVLRTGERGMITIITDGSSLNIEQFR